jgi:hypothetical protein
MDFDGSRLTSIPFLFDLIQAGGSPESLSALHLKSANQTPEYLEILIEALDVLSPKKFIVFDATIDSARFIAERNPVIKLAASVSHPYDVERFNKNAGGTLITMDQLIENQNIFSWAWLDEWDRRDRDGGTKSLLNDEIFKRLRDHGIGIALVTPELHATSPSQPTGVKAEDYHEDGRDRDRLDRRLAEIVALEPDAMCTDHPDFVQILIDKHWASRK